MSELLTRTIRLDGSPERAFAIFTEKIDLWWPRGHRRSREAMMVMEPRPGGRLLERAPDGEEWVIGHVTAIEPPHRLDFDWFPGSPLAPTHVEIAFAAAADGTTIHIMHRAPSPESIAAWPQKVALFERGWDTVLPALRDFIADNRGE